MLYQVYLTTPSYIMRAKHMNMKHVRCISTDWFKGKPHRKPWIFQCNSWKGSPGSESRMLRRPSLRKWETASRWHTSGDCHGEFLRFDVNDINHIQPYVQICPNDIKWCCVNGVNPKVTSTVRINPFQWMKIDTATRLEGFWKKCKTQNKSSN